MCRHLKTWTGAFAAAFLFAFSESPSAAALTEQGEAIAQRLCGACHGLGRAERSPIPSAPAFRRLDSRIDLDDMQDRLEDGNLGDHPQMPVFVLRDDEAAALVAYIKSLRDLD
jgi:cytochrome c